MKRFSFLCLSVVASISYSGATFAAEDWQAKSYSTGDNVCYQDTHFRAKWWAGSSNVPDVNGPTESNQPGWGSDPWLPLLDSTECRSGETPNTPPVADAGSDINVQSPAYNIVLDASGSTDTDGDTLTYIWSQVSGPTLALTNANSVQASINVPELDTDTDYTFRVTVSDGKAQDSDNVKVFATAVEKTNTPPVADAGDDFSVQTPADRVELDAGASHDADGDELTYQWSQVSGPDVLINNPNKVVAHFSLAGLPVTTDLTFKVVVSDGKAQADSRVTVTAKAEIGNAGSLTVKAPARPTGAGESTTLVMKPETGAPVLVDVDWGTSETSALPAGNYKVTLPFTENAIPNPKSAAFAIAADNTISLDWAYQEHGSDSSYFEQMEKEVCSRCHSGNWKPKLADGPSENLLNIYAYNPYIISEKLADMESKYGATCDTDCQATMARYLEEDLWADALYPPHKPRIQLTDTTLYDLVFNH